MLIKHAAQLVGINYENAKQILRVYKRENRITKIDPLNSDHAIKKKPNKRKRRSHLTQRKSHKTTTTKSEECKDLSDGDK